MSGEHRATFGGAGMTGCACGKVFPDTMWPLHVLRESLTGEVQAALTAFLENVEGDCGGLEFSGYEVLAEAIARPAIDAISSVIQQMPRAPAVGQARMHTVGGAGGGPEWV